MNIIADTHTHTIASTHAYSTLQEMVHAAFLKKLYAIAITDHGITMPGAPGRWYFHNLRIVPHLLEGVLVLRGQETNIIDFDGNIDLEKDSISTMDWVVASIHAEAIPKERPTVEEVTNAWMNIAKNPHIHVIGHSGTQKYRYDYESVIPEFGRRGKLVELNESSFTGRESSIPNCKKIMEICKKRDVPVIVNTDSHFSSLVGCFDRSLALLKEVDFPEELVVNSSVERFQAYLREYTDVFSDPLLQ
ncbi:phosphatase [Caproiciproducens sp. R1]|uniref:phosphatase n=1 Tax=Caproiciproducens sp. R1 TaxID=3435000 RepID=UPI004034EC01